MALFRFFFALTRSEVPLLRRHFTLPQVAGVSVFRLGSAPLFMKTRSVILSLLAVSTAVFASLSGPPWDDTKPPTLPLPAAYQLAITALGSATNQVHCVGASINTEFSSPGWYFTFHSTNAANTFRNKRCFCVEFDGKVIEDNFFR